MRFRERTFTYLQKNKNHNYVALPSLSGEHYEIIIVIPCYDENPAGTLESLGNCSLPGSGEVGIILVFNHPEQSPICKKHEHQASLFQGAGLNNGISVHTIEAFELPQKHAGVGLARKIGMDLALEAFAGMDRDGLILCLDADCEVSENYLVELLKKVHTSVKAVNIYFEHKLDTIAHPLQREFIIRYEIWLRYYIQALRYCGYPHAFHTVGSSMGVRASAYAAVGGMNRRKAGEDFYFLHKLIPHGHFHELNLCTVYPSARTSDRVPFGTGRAMMEMQRGTKEFDLVYHHEIFNCIGRWWSMIGDGIFDLNSWPEEINRAFAELNWLREYTELQERSSGNSRYRNFSFWFNGFRMLKLVHHLRDQYFGNQGNLLAASALFEQHFTDEGDLLGYLRSIDREGNPAYLY